MWRRNETFLLDVANNWNDKIIEEFRANDGRVGGPFEGHSLLLLHHRGAKSGIERVNPLASQSLGEGAWAIFASKGGAPINPDWFHNLTGQPGCHHRDRNGSPPGQSAGC